ncbi:histidine-phosphotransfer domain, HPT domain-containing protein [Rhizophagus irregularis]|uniref:Signal transduction histidine kinase n=4 Tax=Rhizophagus irregularis TaxID=588596 RepID=U9UKV9_RHIID|nr:signal transduction histidine kinase [Rhizophagus irregularis DAOM 181602=DAOM 197198]PKC14834.1 histidine-phosphotransfer domain, HPT domain-containing protein [Rhizophagus irregularis]PKC68169.1 histidine-phosphotransfer domain, HPT domain-containing protein [Rhizophagus irregularis]PKY13434.1 histidine-phosphotransfer domain, HPT domain-containing protein [Rhizophagus irregularis]POG74757.1 signal transduction histidine kinase [Rhizophagus irregularis DAOM 181602=DAOM 197198]|eukprot:XP_025181623.1 signal transduction histidine kinase [Rhizophagus irregularis DAOM 181602=DAOM 197198]
MPSTPSPTPHSVRSNDEERVPSPNSDLIDHETFDQLLEMDDDDDHDFSKSIVWNYFEQAETTFGSMDKALEVRDLDELSKLGHFLKGSSAAIGLTKVKASCEKMQHFGNMKDETGTNTISEDDAITKISTLLEKVKDEYKEAETYLKNFYKERDDS